MKILKNKFMISLGAATGVIAPITSVVACGESSVKDISDNEKKQREALNKSQLLIQTKYQEYLISEISNSQKNKNSHKEFGDTITEKSLQKFGTLTTEIKDEIKSFVKRNIYSSATYLTTFADKLLHTVNPNGHKYETQAEYKDAVDAILKSTAHNLNELIGQNGLGGSHKLPTNKTLPTALDEKVVVTKASIDSFVTAVEAVFATDQELVDNANSIGINTSQKLTDRLNTIKEEARVATNSFKDSLDSSKTSSVKTLDKWDDIETKIAELNGLVKTDDEAKAISKTSVLFKFEDLTKDGFYDFYLNKTDVNEDQAVKTKVEKLIDDYFPIIWDNNISNFKNSIYQYMISVYYLNTNKENWTKVFVTPAGSTESITGNEGFLTEDNFVLGLKTLRGKLAFDWTVSLDDNASKAYAGASMTENDIDKQLDKKNKTASSASIYKAATTTVQRSFVPSFDWDNTSTDWTTYVTAAKTSLKDAAKFPNKTWKDAEVDSLQSAAEVRNFLFDKKITSLDTIGSNIWSFIDQNKDIIGFNGIVAKASFATDGNIKPTDGTTYYSYDKNFVGYVNPEKTSEIVEDPNKDIKLTTPSSSKISLEKIVMILPQYIGGSLKLDFLKNTATGTQDAYRILKQIIIANDSSIYNEAINYYSSKDNHEFNWKEDTKTGGIRIKFSKDAYELEKLAIDTFKFSFVEKNED